MSNTLQPHGLQHARTPCLSPTPRVYSNSCPLSQWCHTTISSSAVPLSSLLQSFPASWLFQMTHFFALGSKVLEFQSIGVRLQGKPFNITVIQVNVLTSNAKEAEVERFYEDLHDLLELTPHKKGPLHCRGLECKSHRQIWPWSTEWSRAKANRVLPRENTGHRNTLFQKHKRRLYTWTSPDGQHWNQIDYILCSQRWRSSIQSAKIRLGADCGSDHEILIAKFRLTLKKVGKSH